MASVQCCPASFDAPGGTFSFVVFTAAEKNLCNEGVSGGKGLFF